MLKEQKLTVKELLGYRQWLSELDEESRGEQGTSRQAMDPDLWRIFDPKGNIGRQIYESYTDEALLEAVVVTMDHPGHKPRTYQLSPIRQVYLKQRFGNINKACWAPEDFGRGWKSKSGGRQTGRSGYPLTDSGRIVNGLVLP